METVEQRAERLAAETKAQCQHLIASVQQSPRAKPEQTSKEDEPLSTSDDCDRFWVQAADIWGHKFTSSYGVEPSAVWKLALAGLTQAQIKNGLRLCLAKKLAWPPSLPEFCDMCLEVPGLPDPESAWTEAYALAAKWKQPHECTHPVIWHAYVNSDLDADEEAGKKEFIRNYKIASQQYATGGIDSLREIPKALPAKSVVPKSPEEVAATLRYADEKLAALGIGKRAQA